MPWFNMWDGLKKKTCRYLLQRYLGQFLEEKLNLEQLNVELYNGKATVKDVALKADAINELFDAQGWSVEVTGGKIGLITVTVPWNALMTNDSSIEIADLCICLRPKQRQNNGTSMLESMWSSVSSSLQLAQECMKQADKENENELGIHNESIDGLEKFAETIDNVLNRIKANCSNVTLRLEYLSESCMHGLALVIKVNTLNYQNEGEYNKSEQLNPLGTDKEGVSDKEYIYKLASFAMHNISINEVYIYTEEFKVPCSGATLEKFNTETSEESCNFYSVSSQLTSQTFKDGKSFPYDDRSFGLAQASEGKWYGVLIPILHIEGHQKVIIKTKQSEEINGPKVILDVELGTMCLIASPRQLKILLKFYDLFCDDMNSYSQETNFSYPGECAAEKLSKTMEPCSIYRTNMTGSVGHQNIWSETHEDPLSNPVAGGIADHITGHKYDYKYCESLSSSMSSSSNLTNFSRFHRKVANIDICGDISKFNIRIATILAIILHEDLLVESNINASKSPLNEKNQYDMTKIAEQCFLKLCTDFRNSSSLGSCIRLCDRNHILVQLSPIIADGMQQRNRNIIVSRTLVTATKFNLYEMLEDDKTIPLIDFNRENSSTKGYNQRPELSINIKSTSPFNFKRQDNSTITNFDIYLEKCAIEFDISIYDRLSAIIGSSPFKNPLNRKPQNTEKIRKAQNLEHRDEVKLSSEKLTIKLRFPIVDVRPIHDPDRVPWWKQNIRKDFLLLSLDEIRLIYSHDNIEITSSEINVFYCDYDLVQTKAHLLKVTTACDSNLSEKSVFEYPKIIIKIPKEDGALSQGYDNDSLRHNSSLPFSAKRVCRQSDALHTKHNVSGDSETFLLPGETLEMRRFCDTTMKCSKLQIKVNIPAAALLLESKQMYEIIYNRLQADLFMWEPSSTIYRNVDEYRPQPEMKQSLLDVGLFDSLYVPSTQDSLRINLDEQEENAEQKSALILSSSLESVEEEETICDRKSCSFDRNDNMTSIYVSTQEYSQVEETHSSKSLAPNKAANKQSQCSFELTVGKANLTLIVPTRDSGNRVLPGQLGKFIAKVKALNIFFVSGHNGNKNLGYLCLNLKNIEVHHCGLLPVDFSTSISIDSELPVYMQSTFYKTPKGLIKGRGKGCNTREMLSLVVEIKKIPEQNIKRLKITTGLQKTTLRHNPALPPQTWLSQLLDFLDVVDYPISGYEPFGIITEMQLHFWDCAIDYRPKYFPYRAVVEIGAFDVSSNIISSIPGCTLRFVAEECVLSIASFDNLKTNYPENSITYLPSSDLVPILDIGLLDISLRLSDKSTEKCPKFDLRSVIRDVHLRTCADSGSAFAQLIAYLANDGDLPRTSDDESSSLSPFSSTHSNSKLFDVNERKSSTVDVSEEQQERVNKLMAEAVRESIRETALKTGGEALPKSVVGEPGFEVFYFPDEGNQSSQKKYVSNLQGCEENENADEDESISSVTIKNDETSSSSDLCDMLNFEVNVMTNSYQTVDDKGVEALPQIKRDLGDITSKENPITEEELNSSKDDDYCLIADEEKSYMSNFGIKNVHLTEDPLRIVDNHFCVSTGKPDLLKPPESFPIAVLRYTLCEMSFTWHLYGGNDFPLNEVAANQSGLKSSIEIDRINKTTMSQAYKYGVSYAKTTESLQYGKKPKDKLTWKTTGGPNRNHEVLVEIQLSKVRFSHEVYPVYTTQASRQVLVVNEIEIRDRLQSSDINKFLYHPKSKNLPRKTDQNMIVIKALHARPDQKIAFSQECSLRISLLPLRLHIDQDTLLFLLNFFTNLGNRCSSETNYSSSDPDNSSSSLPTREIQEPVMMVDDIPEAVQDLHARRLVSTNLDLLTDENKSMDDRASRQDTVSSRGDGEYMPLYFREVVFSPEVLIRFDYHGRRVELSRGPVAGLLMGLGQLQCSEIKLKKIVYRRGLLGVEKLINYLCKEWLKDIKKNQLPNILSGVGPTYAFIQLFQGIYDLFWLPIEQFQKDGRIIKGLQLGAQSFTARTALAALEITSRIIQLLQFTAETAFDMVSPGPTVRSQRARKGRRKRPHRPKDIREGVTNAYTIVKEGFNDSAQTLMETAAAEHDQKGYTGAVGAVMRQIPQLVVCPAVLATQATTNILGGVKNSLVPEAKLEARDKWKDDTD